MFYLTHTAVLQHYKNVPWTRPHVLPHTHSSVTALQERTLDPSTCFTSHTQQCYSIKRTYPGPVHMFYLTHSSVTALKERTLDPSTCFTSHTAVLQHYKNVPWTRPHVLPRTHSSVTALQERTLDPSTCFTSHTQQCYSITRTYPGPVHMFYLTHTAVLQHYKNVPWTRPHVLPHTHSSVTALKERTLDPSTCFTSHTQQCYSITRTYPGPVHMFYLTHTAVLQHYKNVPWTRPHVLPHTHSSVTALQERTLDPSTCFTSHTQQCYSITRTYPGPVHMFYLTHTAVLQHYKNVPWTRPHVLPHTHSSVTALQERTLDPSTCFTSHTQQCYSITRTYPGPVHMFYLTHTAVLQHYKNVPWTRPHVLPHTYSSVTALQERTLDPSTCFTSHTQQCYSITRTYPGPVHMFYLAYTAVLQHYKNVPWTRPHVLPHTHSSVTALQERTLDSSTCFASHTQQCYSITRKYPGPVHMFYLTHTAVLQH